MTEDVKWDCEYCTYKNYPASRKCVLCHAQRPLQVISDLENSEQDIYKVAEIEARNSENFISNKDLERKWECTLCFFLNPISSPKCTQCQKWRKHAGSPSQHPKDLTKPLAVRTQPTSVGSPFPTGQSSKISPVSPCSSTCGKTADCGKGLSKKKWACKACTYENYPTSNQCTMCRTPKGLTYVGEASQATSSSYFSLHVDTKNQENIRSGQNSPVNGNNENEQQKVHIQGQRSPPNNRSGQSSPINNREISSQLARKASSGTSSPNNRSSPTSPHSINLNQDPVIPYTSSSGQNSPKTQSGQSSPKSNRSGQVSPQDHTSSGQVSPHGHVQGSPLIARASRDSSNRNQNKHRNDSLIIQDGTGAMGGVREEDVREIRLHKLRRKLTTEDLIWLKACESVVSGDPSGIEQFLASGGDPARQLTKDEVQILNRPSAFEFGYTLVHLALRFRQDDMVAILLTATDISSKGFKRLPSYTSPDLSADIRREVSVMLRQRKGSFACYFLTECATFSLPAG